MCGRQKSFRRSSMLHSAVRVMSAGGILHVRCGGSSCGAGYTWLGWSQLLRRVLAHRGPSGTWGPGALVPRTYPACKGHYCRHRGTMHNGLETRSRRISTTTVLSRQSSTTLSISVCLEGLVSQTLTSPLLCFRTLSIQEAATHWHTDRACRKVHRRLLDGVFR